MLMQLNEEPILEICKNIDANGVAKLDLENAAADKVSNVELHTKLLMSIFTVATLFIVEFDVRWHRRLSWFKILPTMLMWVLSARVTWSWFKLVKLKDWLKDDNP